MSQVVRSNNRKVNLKRNDDDQITAFEGYGIVFFNEADPGTQYVLWGDGVTNGAVERIMPGCEIVLDDVRCMYNHDTNQLLGREQSGTMTVTFDEIGARYECPFDAADPDHQRVAAKVKRGDVDGSSFWFYIETETPRTENDVTIYEVTKVRVKEMGPVTFPAYEATTAETRDAHIARRKEAIEAKRKAASQAEADQRSRQLWMMENLGIPTSN